MRRIFIITITALSILLIGACVSHKKKSDAKVGWFKKRYHNLTSKYNYWFNANELLHITAAKMEESHKDNYNQILDIYPAVAADPQAAKGDLDNVIKKASTGIALHRPSGWADDCYTIIGVSQYYKKDLETAEATFKYIKDELDPHKKVPKVKSKKKKVEKKKKASKKKSSSKKKKGKSKAKTKEERAAEKAKTEADKKAQEEREKQREKDEEAAAARPDGTNPYKKGWSRTSAWPEAMIWYSRTLTDREKYDEAGYQIQTLWEDPWFPSKFKDDLATAEAYLWIKQKSYAKAIPPLEKAVALTKKKKRKARLSYILAQLYDRSGQHDQAIAAFSTAIKGAPNFEMEFNARLHQVRSEWAFGKSTNAEAEKALHRFLKEDKNAEYRDQVYFTLAEVALKDKRKPEAIEYLKQALASSKGNAAQKAESYLALADLYFEIEDFVEAKNYYDSTLTALPAADERYSRVNKYATNLKDIAHYIEIIEQNDSIIKVYSMSDVERKDLAKKIKKQREKENAASQSAAAGEKSSTSGRTGPGGKTPPSGGAKPSSFYFYNESFVKKGKKEFAKVWGNRKLEDNWRRGQKRSSAGDTTDDPAVAANDSTKAGDLSDTELNDIFQTLPKSEGELSVIHLNTYEALYKLGTLFRDKLDNNQRCVSTLEEELHRYPDTVKYQRETWYYLVVAYKDLRNETQAKYYLDKLVEKYPNSPHARTLSDPNFLNASKEREKDLNKFYQQAYAKFLKADYKTAFDDCQEAPRKYGSTNPLMPKFSLLSALCVGNLQGKDAYCTALKDVIGRYPESSEAVRAREIARLMSCPGFEITEETKEVAGEEKFQLEDDKLHYFMVALSGDEVRLDEVKAAISDYNREHHKSEQLRISNIFLGTDTSTPIIVIRKFDKRSDAMRYLKEVENKKDFLGETRKTFKKESFVITQENYRKVLKNKTLNGYREFFQDNYNN